MTTPDDDASNDNYQDCNGGAPPAMTEADAGDRSRFRAGELALFLDRKGRTYQETLSPAASSTATWDGCPTTTSSGSPWAAGTPPAAAT